LGLLPIDEIMRRSRIGHADVAMFRRVFYEDGVVSRDEAELLFKLNEACPVQHSDWADFFVEALTDYLVFQEAPRGYVTSSNAHWLIDNLSPDGRIRSRTELELVVNVLDKARWAPVSLVKFALEQVKQAVIFGSGPLRGGKVLEPGRITEG